MTAKELLEDVTWLSSYPAIEFVQGGVTYQIPILDLCEAAIQAERHACSETGCLRCEGLLRRAR